MEKVCDIWEDKMIYHVSDIIKMFMTQAVSGAEYVAASCVALRSFHVPLWSMDW